MSATPNRTVPVAVVVAAEPPMDAVGALVADAADVVSAWAGLLDRDLVGTTQPALVADRRDHRTRRHFERVAQRERLARRACRSTYEYLVVGITAGTGMQLLQRWMGDLILPKSRAVLVHPWSAFHESQY